MKLYKCLFEVVLLTYLGREHVTTSGCGCNQRCSSISRRGVDASLSVEITMNGMDPYQLLPTPYEFVLKANSQSRMKLPY